jgi:uncharacterized repeat protein (TIGR01451 family)
VLVALAACAGGLSVIPGKATAVNAGSQKELTPETLRIKDTAARQIQALLQEKESRTPAQQKIDSHLLQTLKMSRNEVVAEGIDKIETGIAPDDKGLVLVDIKATVTRSLLARLRRLGGEIINSFDNDIRARLPLAELEALASLPQVTFIRPADLGMTQGAAQPSASSTPAAVSKFTLPDAPRAIPQLQTRDPRLQTRPGFEARAATVRAQLSRALLEPALFKPTYRSMMMFHTDSQGDVAHQADLARSTYGINGSGVKIGVMSDGVDSLASLQAAGDLPSVMVLTGQAGSGNEGSAMLEIVFDLAPGAQLFFATAGAGSASFASNIRALRMAGCDIIVDDFSYFAESPFQDGQTGSSTTNGGIITQAVNDVTAGGALYFSSSANDGNLDDGSGTWEGDFADSGTTVAGLSGGTLNDFGSGNLGDTFTSVGTNEADLFWSDPLGGSSNDYDFFLLDSNLTTVLAASTNTQSGTQDPFEFIPAKDGMNNPLIKVGTRLAILKKTGAANRFLHIATNRSRLSVATQGATKGHPCAAAAYGVAAVDVANAMGGAFTGGSADPVEKFSSDGPRHLFFQADGTPFNGDFSSTGGIIRQKPDITAADGVSTDVMNFSPFFGTSAAAPHAAAIAGLLKSYKPGLTPDQIRSFLTSSALDIQAAGVDRDSGFGIVMAFAALTAASTSDLSVSMTASPSPVTAASNITYKITLSNNGPDTAVNIALSDSLPAGTSFVSCNSTAGGICGGVGNNRSVSFSSLASAASATIMIVASVDCSNADGTIISNTVNESSLTPDTNLTNDSFTASVTVSNPAPQIACPANIAVGTANRGAGGQVVTFPAPVVTSPCLASLSVNPPSGSVFPPGVTTVTATATDTLGRTVSCAFTVTVYNVCLRNASTGDILEFSTTTGDYKFIHCPTGFTLVGKGSISVVNSVVFLSDTRSDRRVNANFLEGQLTGSAVISFIPAPGLSQTFRINDLSTVNSCMCH